MKISKLTKWQITRRARGYQNVADGIGDAHTSHSIAPRDDGILYIYYAKRSYNIECIGEDYE